MFIGFDADVEPEEGPKEFSGEKRSIAGSLRYVEVKTAPLHWRYYMKRVFQR